MFLRILPILLCGISSMLAAPPAEKQLAKKFFQQPAAMEARLTPGNRGLSYIAHEHGNSILKVLNFESGKTSRLRIDGSPEVYDYDWIDRNTVVVFAHVLGTPIGAFVTNFNLSSPNPTLFARVYDTLPDVKSMYIAKEGKTTDKFPDLYRINAHTESKARIEENPGNVLAWLTDKDGLPRIRIWIDENEKDVYEYRSHADDDWRALDLQGQPAGVSFLPEPDQFILFVRRDGSDKFAAYRFDGKRNQFLDTILSDPTYDILYTEFIVDPETEESYGFRFDREKPQTFWFDETLARIQARVDESFPETVNYILGYAAAKDSVIVRRFSDRLPDEWRHYYLDTGESDLIVQSLPDVATEDTVPTEPVSFPSVDGPQIHGYLTRPRNSEDTPTKALLMIHGGPRHRDSWRWDSEAQYFANLGYTVLKINYRGSEGYGLSYSPHYHLSAIETSVKDAVDGAKWLIDQGYASPRKIGIYGSSFGGHVALTSAAEAPDLFACAIGYAGVYNWLEELDEEFKEEPVYARLKMKTYYGDYENEREKWLAASAISKIDSISCPVFLIHGKADETVSSMQSRRMHKALKKAGKDSRLKLLNFNRHGLAQEKNRITFYTELALFLKNAIQD